MIFSNEDIIILCRDVKAAWSALKQDLDDVLMMKPLFFNSPIPSFLTPKKVLQIMAKFWKAQLMIAKEIAQDALQKRDLKEFIRKSYGAEVMSVK